MILSVEWVRDGDADIRISFNDQRVIEFLIRGTSMSRLAREAMGGLPDSSEHRPPLVDYGIVAMVVLVVMVWLPAVQYRHR